MYFADMKENVYRMHKIESQNFEKYNGIQQSVVLEVCGEKIAVKTSTYQIPIIDIFLISPIKSKSN